VNTDPVGPDQEGFAIEDPNLEESDHGEEDLEEHNHDFQEHCTPHLAREISFSILEMSRILPLPTRAQE